MNLSIRSYFENTIISTIIAAYPAIAAEMSIIVLGSQGLGIADQFSDLEAAVYLDDALWRAQGGQLQLLLNACLQTTCPCRLAGSVIAVWPQSWLLGGCATALRTGQPSLPWESVAIEELFTMQENLIVWDPQGFLAEVKQTTSPSHYPLWLWKKRLFVAFKTLLDDFSELSLNVKRSRQAEAHILFGEVLRTLFHIGFFINRQYYPWRTHLRWAFARLPRETSTVLTHLERAVTSSGWEEKLEATNQVIAFYKEFITHKGLLLEIDLLSADLSEELIWAERLKAWENPHWRDWITRCQEKAMRDGHHPKEFWVWSLWHWE
ncbi:MAG: DUF4037 domain-containing protein [Caldilineaceae bacterium]